ncbi:MAG: hypothetical protein GXY44_03985 [Phycisphaerales bacterium]|nr:hypothetical protein [Phycisphaerales bacterium]
MFQRCAAITTFGLVVFLSISTAAAGDWTISEGGSYDISTQIGGGANLAAGDAIIIDGATDPNPVTIRIDSGAVPALGKADKPAIWIKAPVTVTIQFVGTNNLRLGHEDGTALRIYQDGGALTVDGNGHFDFSANENKVLTLTGIANAGQSHLKCPTQNPPQVFLLQASF